LYGEFDLGITDASLVVLAARYETRDVLTFDERHFRKVTPIQGGSFRLLPLDG
jgi:predicted nucleic acid-binding protein